MSPSLCVPNMCQQLSRSPTVCTCLENASLPLTVKVLPHALSTLALNFTVSQELLKYTDRSHPDSERIKSAVDGMKEVAQTVNERKRRVENIHFIGKWRRSVDNWEVSICCTLQCSTKAPLLPWVTEYVGPCAAVATGTCVCPLPLLEYWYCCPTVQCKL